MIRAAGVIYVADNRVLFLKRGPAGDQVGAWCIPGGKIEGAETPAEAAKREFEEETGAEIEGDLQPWTRRVATDPPLVPPPSVQLMPAPPPAEVDFTTFIVSGKAFEPALNDEHCAYAWAPADSPPEPLHPGCRVALARFTADELGIARMMQAGDLTSPQRYGNVWLFDLRITGTGTAYRQAIDEVCYRPPQNYLTPDFLARCNGLLVVWEHPKNKPMLDQKEFKDRTIGSIMLPYIGDGLRHPMDEVWGIAKIYDAAAAKLMESEKLSTSPSVVYFRNVDEGVRMGLEDGSTLLIENKPSLLDHLAICEVGVWDKGEEPSGVRADSTGATTMTPEEEKAKKDAEEAARAAQDASGGTALDKTLKFMGDTLKACADGIAGLGKRMDAMEEGEKARKDAEEKEKAEKEKADKAKADAEAEEKRKAGDAEQLAADKAKKDAEEKEAKEKADKARKDEEDKRRADSEEVRKKIADVEAKLPKPLTDADYPAMADAQARADSVFQAFGKQAPGPLNNESPLAYRKRMVTQLQAHSTDCKGVDVYAMSDEAAFKVIEERVFADALAAAANPPDLGDGELRTVTKRNPLTGGVIHEFVGRGTFIRGMKPPTMHARLNPKPGTAA